MSFRSVPPSLPPTPGSGQSLRRALEVGVATTLKYEDLRPFRSNDAVYIAFTKSVCNDYFDAGSRYYVNTKCNLTEEQIETLKSMIEGELRQNGWPDNYRNFNADFSVKKYQKDRMVDEFQCYIPKEVTPPKEFSKTRHSETPRSQSMPSARDYSMKTNGRYQM